MRKSGIRTRLPCLPESVGGPRAVADRTRDGRLLRATVVTSPWSDMAPPTSGLIRVRASAGEPHCSRTHVVLVLTMRRPSAPVVQRRYTGSSVIGEVRLRCRGVPVPGVEAGGGSGMVLLRAQKQKPILEREGIRQRRCGTSTRAKSFSGRARGRCRGAVGRDTLGRSVEPFAARPGPLRGFGLCSTCPACQRVRLGREALWYGV
jgi:hypothetical protein